MKEGKDSTKKVGRPKKEETTNVIYFKHDSLMC